jgi:F-type H+-transporting ATPase subunit b
VGDLPLPLTVAVMGCVVNGPGEAREADVGIAGGDGAGALFVKGEPTRKVEGDLAEARKLKEESEAALKAYESELAEARLRAQAIGNETREKMNAQAEAERKTLEEQLAAKLAEAEKTIASTRQAAMNNVRDIAADAASTIVQQLIGTAPNAKSVGAAVDAVLKG